MIFIGGTNHGRTDGGMPAPGAKYHAINRLDCAGRRETFREIYYRHDRYWLHESLDTPEKIAKAIRDYEGQRVTSHQP